MVRAAGLYLVVDAITNVFFTSNVLDSLGELYLYSLRRVLSYSQSSISLGRCWFNTNVLELGRLGGGSRWWFALVVRAPLSPVLAALVTFALLIYPSWLPLHHLI